jgi:hypothetical protein
MCTTSEMEEITLTKSSLSKNFTITITPNHREIIKIIAINHHR